MRKSARLLVTSPLRLGTKGWGVSVAVVLSASLAYVWKRPIHSVFMGDDRGLPEFFADIGKYLGGGQLVVLTVAALMAIGFISRRSVLVEAGLVLAVAGIWCAVVTTMGQIVLAEARPEEGGAMAFFGLEGHGVSGHVSSAAVLFWPIYSVLGRYLYRIYKVILGILLLGWATLVGWSRMWDDKHFLWNVILGLAVGFSIGYLVIGAWEELKIIMNDE